MSDRDGILSDALAETLAPIVARLVQEELERRLPEPPPARDDEALSVAEVARLCHVTKKTVYGAISRNELVASRLGSRFRVRRSDVDAWLDRTRVEPPAKGSTRILKSRPRRRARRYGGDAGLRRLVAPYEKKE
jgi:excisionase family DNA binding protein